jgi:DNA-binding winged helix-turn-helix (wHTH) protein
MGKDELPIYEFEDFRLDAEKYILSRAGETLSLTPKVFETLLLPMKRAGKVLKKDELLRAVWTDAILEENNLNQYISALRRLPGEYSGENRYIATVQVKGYLFIPNVRAP